MSNSVVEEIKSRINIVDFIGQYLRLSKAGANWKALCPFHNEKTPSFMVHEDKQIWHCFGCGKGGDVFGFLMEMERLDFKESLKVLAEKTGVELKAGSHEKTGTIDKNKILEILEISTKFYETQLWKGMGKDKILDYLQERGLGEESIKNFRLGYAPPGWRNLLNFLLKRNYSAKEIEKTGILVKKENDSRSISNPGGRFDYQPSVISYYDRFRDRIIFPITDLMGKVIGFSARVAPGGDESQAKYVNTSETSVYNKSRVLYGIDKAKTEIKNRDTSVLVEGNMDVIAAHQAGIKNTVAVSGTALTSEQLDILKRYSRNIKIFFDTDTAGWVATVKSAKIAFQKGMNASIIESPGGKDAAEIALHNPQKLKDAINNARPAMEVFLRTILSKYDKKDPTGKKNIVEEALELVSHIASEVEKEHWIKKISEELEIDFKIVSSALKKTAVEKRRLKENILSEKENPAFIDRTEILKRDIIGMMLARPEAWQYVLEKHKHKDFFQDDSRLQILFQKGSEANFKVDRLLAIAENEKMERYFRNLFFESRYIFDAQGEAEEISGETAIARIKNCISEMIKEEKKKKLSRLLSDIKKAERSNDREELRFLIEEFNKLSKELK